MQFPLDQGVLYCAGPAGAETKATFDSYKGAALNNIPVFTQDELQEWSPTGTSSDFIARQPCAEIFGFPALLHTIQHMVFNIPMHLQDCCNSLSV